MNRIEAKLTAVFVEYCTGIQDAVSLHRTLLFYIHSKTIRVCTIKCAILNGLIFLGSIFFFDKAVIPIIHWFGELLHTSAAYRFVDYVYIALSPHSIVEIRKSNGFEI